MNPSKLDETNVEKFLVEQGLKPTRYSKDDMASGKTPDFKVYYEDKLVFFVEVKSLFSDDWDDGVRPDPTYNRVQNKIHEAVKQFDEVNPERNYPNVLTLVNHVYDSDVYDLLSVFDGIAYCENGHKLPIFKKYSKGRIFEEKYRIDLFIWFEKDGTPKWRFVMSSPFKEHLCYYFKINISDIKLES